MNMIAVLFVLTTQPDTVLCSRWGNRPGHFGLRVQDDFEVPPFGPTAFGIGQDGLLYIDDCENQRIQVISPDGKVKRIVYKPDGMGCFWDITADVKGRVMGIVYTGLVDTPAFVAIYDRRWMKIPLPASISRVRGACRLYPTRNMIYLAFLRDGAWHSAPFSADTASLLNNAREGIPAWNGRLLHGAGNVIGGTEDGKVATFRIDGTRGIVMLDGDTVAIWELSMFVDFYDDPYAIASDGTVYVLTTSPRNLCILRFKPDESGHHRSGKVRLDKVPR